MRQKARELDVEEHVLFLGKQNDVSAFYQLSDLVLLLSEKESFGLTLRSNENRCITDWYKCRWH